MAAPSRGERTPRQVRNAIDRLDLRKLVDKAVKLHRWREKRAGDADIWYRNFLWLTYKSSFPIAMLGRDADELWHLHILDTRKYRADCEKVFGHFLEHVPLYGEPTARDLAMYKQTQEAYLAEFGKFPPFPRPLCHH